MPRNGGRGAGQTDTADEVFAAQGKCPVGHPVGHKGRGGTCTPLKCNHKAADSAKGTVNPKRLRTQAELEQEQEEKFKERLAIVQAKRKFLGVPENLEGDDAEQWMDRKLTQLGVHAVAELEEQLFFGDKDDRRHVAYRILDSIGRGKRDGSANVGGPTIIVMGAQGGAIPLPWSRDMPKLMSGTTTVTGTVTVTAKEPDKDG